MTEKKGRIGEKISLDVFLEVCEIGCLVSELIYGLEQGETGEENFISLSGISYSVKADPSTGSIMISLKKQVAVDSEINLIVQRLLTKEF